MEVHTDRTELLASCSPNASIKHAPSGLLSPPLMADDKDSIYTFSDNCKSDNESESIGKCSLSNDTDSSGLNNHAARTKRSPRNDVRAVSKKPPMTPTTLTDTPSSSPLQPGGQPTVASPPSTSHDQTSPRPNGSVAGSPSTASATSPKKVLSGKPRAFAEANKAAATAAATSRASSARSNRGRQKCKALVTMYQSQLTDNKIGIKIRLKKSLEAPVRNAKSAATKRKSRPATAAAAAAAPTAASAPKTTNRKRSRKSKQKGTSDSDDSEYEKRRRVNHAATDKVKNRKSTANSTKDYTEPEEQSVWGSRVPEEILLRIFENAVDQHGCLPTIVNIGQVCTLWRRVSLDPKLWHTLDLATWTKDRSEPNLKYIIKNHLRGCKDLNLANWKVTNIECVLGYLLEACPNLVGISLAGWKKFTSDQLATLVEEFKKLERIDLSSVNLEINPNKSAVGIQSLCSAIQKLESRLTHLYLAHNRLAGIPQLVTSLSTHCPNLSLLDLSNIQTVAVSHGILQIEKLQEGCPHLKVLRITNSHITLSAVTLQEQMDSPGFPELEELSVASLQDESRLMNDEFLQRILKTSTKLKLLDVRGCARLTHDTLIRLPTWDLKHLFLSGCSITRDIGSGLELIASKWAHSLTEFDLAWANVQEPLDNAIKAIAEKGADSPLNHLNLCGSSVSLEAVKEILINCRYLTSINLASCRGLPRGVKRLLQGTTQIAELRQNLGVKLKGDNSTVASVESTNKAADK